MELQPAGDARIPLPAEEARADTQPARVEEADAQPTQEAGADTSPGREAPRVEPTDTRPGREAPWVEPRPEAEAAGQRRFASCRNALRDWRPSLWVSLPLASAFTMFLTLVTIEGTPVNLWTVSAVVVIVVLLIVAGVAACFCSTTTPAGPQRGGEQEV